MSFPHLTTITPFEDNVTDVLAEDQIHHAIFGDIQVTTLPTAITWSATAGSTGQTLKCSGATFVSSGVVAGQVAYNSTDGSYSIIKSVDSETQITTTPLKWGSANVWASGNSFSLKAAPYMRVCLTQTDGANQSGTYIRNSANNAWVNLSPVTTTLWSDNTTIPTSKAVKDVTDLKAPLASPALTGTPTAPTASAGNNSTQIATTGYVDNAISKTPTYTVTDKTSSGGVFNGSFEIWSGTTTTDNTYIGGTDYGWKSSIYLVTGGSITFDTSISYTGRQSLKMTCSANTGEFVAHQSDNINTPTYGSACRVKPSTSYRVSGYIKTQALTGTGANIFAKEFNNSTYLSVVNSSAVVTGTSDWTYVSKEFTTGASTNQVIVACSMGTWETGVGYVWFDGIQIEEVITTTNDNLSGKEQGVIGYTAVGTEDNVDQSQTSITASENLGSIGKLTQYQKVTQTFIPTKSKHTGVVIRRQSSTGSFTGNIIVNVETTSGGSPTWTVLATYTIPNATWQAATANVTDITVPLPCLLTPGTTYAYTFASSAAFSDTNFTNISMHSSNSYASWQWQGWNGSGWGTLGYNFDIYFKTLYYKPTTGFHSTLHNVSNILSTDSDGILNGAKIDIQNKKMVWEYDKNNTLAWNYNNAKNVYSASFWGRVNPNWSVINWWGVWPDYVDSNWFFSLASTTDDWMIWKVNCPFKMLSAIIRVQIFDDATSTSLNKVQASLDWVNWRDIFSKSQSWLGYPSYNVAYNDINANTFFIRMYQQKNSESHQSYFGLSSINVDIDTSSFKTLYAYPTNKDISQTYTKLINSATTSATYMASKYGFPAIEYAEGVFQYLQVDTSSAIYVKFSPDGTTYTTMSDGSSISLSSTTLPVVYTIVKIPTNRLLQSSDDQNNDSTKDPSLKWNVTVLDKVQGMKYDLQDLQMIINRQADYISQIESPWIDFTVSPSWGWSMTTTLLSWSVCRYKIIGKTAYIRWSLNLSHSWTASSSFYIWMPAWINIWAWGFIWFGDYYDGSHKQVSVFFDNNKVPYVTLVSWWNFSLWTVSLNAFATLELL